MPQIKILGGKTLLRYSMAAVVAAVVRDSVSYRFALTNFIRFTYIS